MIPRKILHGKISVIQDDPGKESGEGLSTWMVSREEDAIRQQEDASDGVPYWETDLGNQLWWT